MSFRLKSLRSVVTRACVGIVSAGLTAAALATPVKATPFTTISPNGTALPSAYPEAGGVALILYGANGNIYYQFSDPAGAFVGFQNTGQPAAFRGNPFTINDPLTLDCGLQTCSDYFGGQIVEMEVRFTAEDGDTQQGGFDEDDISLLINGINIGNWSDVPTENTNDDGTVALSSQLGFGNRTFDTGWFNTTNPTLLSNILNTETITTQVLDDDPNDNFWNFQRGGSLPNPGLERVAPAYTLDKRARSGSFGGPDITTFGAVGETIFYTYDIQNVGSVRIDNLNVLDDRLGSISCSPTSINVGEFASCQQSHVVTQPEFDAQDITNVAQATGTPEFGQLGTLSDTVTLTGPGRTPGIEIVKTPKNGTFSAEGETITYQFAVTNTGDVTLSNVSVTDPLLPTLNCQQTSLAPTDTLNCSFSYSVTQDDLDAGSIVNTATAQGTDPAGTGVSDTDTATNTAQQNPAFSVVKSTPDTPTAAGQTLTYTFAVRNDGNVSISNVTPADAKCASPITLSSGDADNDGELDPTETHIFSCTSQAITQDEIDAGQIDNQVTVSGTPAGGALAPVSDDLSTPVARSSGFNVVKSTTSAPTAAGQTLDYRFEVTNTGNASILGVGITDANCAAAPTLQSGDADGDSEIDPPETWVYTCTSVPVTQVQVDAGQVDNTVNLTGTGADGGALTGTDTLETPIPRTPAFSVVKNTTSTPIREGDTLNYTFNVTNDGNVTISGVTLSDAKCASAITLQSGDTDGDGALDVGEVHVFACTSVPVTQPEVDAGQVDNAVTVTGTAPGGNPAPANGGTSTPIPPQPALSLDKRLNAASPTTFDDTSDVLLFDFVVTNTGNVTLTSAISITDPLLDGPATCPGIGAGLAPGGTITCTGQHTVTQPDIDAGQFVNSASATSGATTSNTDSVTVMADQQPELSLVKTATEPSPFTLGAQIDYTYVVTNTGNVTIPATETITVTDNRVTPVNCPLIPPAGLAPNGGTLTCTASYFVVLQDLQLGTVTNIASATDGTTTSNTASATVPNNFAPALSLTKTADPLSADFDEAGDIITYRYEVQNTGGAAFTDTITISDNRINNGTPFPCWVPSATDLTFDPDPGYPGGTPPTAINGETFVCTADYPVTQDDIDAGMVENEAVAQTVFAPGGANIPVASPAATETVTFTLPAAMTVAKQATPADLTPAAPGDVITYTFTLTNTGETTLDDAVPVDTGPTFGGQPASGALSAFTVTSGPDGNTDGRVDTLAPDAVATVTATYTLTQEDIDNAAAAADPATSIANTATGTATPRNGTLAPVTPAPATTGFTPEPAFVVSKETASTPTEEGDTLDYTFFLQNTGNVSISTIALTDPKCDGGPTFESGDLDGDNVLDVGETWRYTCTSVGVTQDEVDAGEVENTVTASGDPAGGTLDDATATITTEIDPDAMLDVVKSTTSTPTAAGQTLDYTFVVTNLGNVSLTPGVLDDPKCAAAPALQSGDTNNDGALNPTETFTYTCTSIPVTQAEVNAGTVDNTVTVPATDPNGDPVDPESDTVETPIAATPAFAVTKATTDVPTTEGQQLTYSFSVVNNGNVSLNNISVTDAKCEAAPALQSGDANGNSLLDPTETFLFECTSIPVTQTEIDSGEVVNTATLAGNAPDGSALTPVTDELRTPVEATPSFVLTKSSASAPENEGDTLEYAFTLTNDGNVSISAITITDAKCDGPVVLDPASDAGGDLVLSPTEVWSLSCTSIPVTQAEVDAGEVVNTASATGTPTGGTLDPAPADNTTPIGSTPSVAMVKSSSSTPAEAGDTLVYEFTVTNTGNTSVGDVTITDAKCAAAPTLQSGDANGDSLLNPTETFIFECTSIPVTQAEVDAGEVLNTASVVAEDPFGTETPPAEATNETPVAEAGAFSVVKATSSAVTAADQTLDYTFTVSNDGNVSISDIVVTDAKCAAAPTLQSGDNNGDNLLDPTETFVFACTSIPVTQAEVDAGLITNSVSVAGNVPEGDPLTPATDDNVVGVTPLPSIEAIKTITSTGVALGDIVTFDIDVENTGNVTLTGVSVTDTLTRNDVANTVLTPTNPVTFVSASENSSAGTLIPGETAIYRLSYVLTQEDIDAGGIANTATATGTPPGASPVTDVSDNDIPADGEDNPTVLVIPAQPAISMLKSLEAVTKADGTTAAGYDTVGDRIDYLFTVTNDGNVTITDPITITDPLITNAGGSIICDPVPLAPNASLECRGSYVVDQNDINTGQVENTATASDGTTGSDPSEVTVPAVQDPALEVTKTARPFPSAQFIVGAIVTYDYVATNTGNTTLTDPIVITDNLIPASRITCPPWPGTLDPGGTYACTGTYTVSVDDVNLGSVTNLADATSGTVTSPQVAETIPDGATPALTIAKSSPDTSFSAVGDILRYSFTVTNSGTRAFVQPVVVRDDRIGDITCFTSTAANPDFTPGEQVTCTADYTVTQADLDDGLVTNEAFAQTTFRNNDEVVSPPTTLTIDGTLTPALDLEKLVSLPAGRTNETLIAGDVLSYTLQVRNTGNQTVSNVVANDTLLGLTCPLGSIAPGAVDTSCQGTLTLTQDDIDAGEVINTATVTGADPQGGSVTDTDVLNTPMPTPNGALEIVKTASVDPFGPVGSTITYGFAVQNTGNITLSDLVVTDAALFPGFSCAIPRVLPGQTDTSCFATHTVTQEDVDAGSITNTATATATDANGNPVTGSDTIVTQGPASSPGLEATKTFIFDGTVAGANVTYFVQVENTGNVTLTNVTPVDTLTSPDTNPRALNAPGLVQTGGDLNGNNALDVGEIFTYQGTYTLTQADVDAGGLTNSVLVTATTPGGGTVDDVSDDGIDTDGNTTDDPTVFDIPFGPNIGAVKTLTTAGAVAGDTVIFDIVVRNLGNQNLDTVIVDDTLTRADGTPLALTSGPTFISGDTSEPGVLNLREVWTYQVSYVLTQADIDAGGISNVATVTATTPQGGTVSDVADNGDPFDGNTLDDPTVLTIPPAPALEVRKSALNVPEEVGDVVTFLIELENTGNVTLSSPALTDTLTRADDQATVLTLASGPDFTSATAGSTQNAILPGGVASFEATYAITQDDIDAGGIENTVTANVSTPTGPIISDTSDDPNSPATGPSDPTLVTIPQRPSVAMTKAVTDVQILFPTVVQVTFEVTVENDGNTLLNNLNIEDDLAAWAAPAVIETVDFPTTISVTGLTSGEANPTYDGVSDTQLFAPGATLARDETAVITITATYGADAGFPAPGENTVTATSDELVDPDPATVIATSVDSDGDGVPDGIESNTEDRDGDGIPDAQDYDPTGYFYCEDSGRILSGGLITVAGNGFTQTGVGSAGPIRILRDGSSGEYQFFVTRPGTYQLSYVPPSDRPSPTRLPTTTPTDVTTLADVLTGSTTSNPRVLGSSEFGNTGALADFSATGNPAFYTSFVFEAGDPSIFSNNIPFQCEALGDLVATKSVLGQSDVRLGDLVTYQLTYDLAAGAADLRDLTFTDILPVGISYLPGSANITRDGGAEVALEPVRSGRRLSWAGEMMSAGTRTIITFSGRVGPNAPTGNLVNQTFALGPTGTILSNVAEAVVRRTPEHVFDCSDVIGKVFDDRNRNGYQDGPSRDPGISDQSFDSKLGTPTEPEGEPGLPGVRIATVNGTLITTDKFGRFHVPCAELPANIGTNFILKVDERSLPSGYRMTTENPRVVRLTAGKFAKMNFGAALGRVIDITLNGSAFSDGANATPKLEDAVRNLSRTLAKEPSVVRLAYVAGSEAEVKVARARLRTVEKLLRRMWRRNGTYKLTIEKTIQRRQ